MEACVDPLVLQLEDEDPRVRLATLEKLRKVAAVESVHFPVRNPRRFLQCLRRRALDEDAEVAREAWRLVVDVMPALGDDAEQILSSILPHLIPQLPSSKSPQPPGTDNEVSTASSIDDEIYRVFRKYVAVCNDFTSVTELLVNIGLAHARASVRESSLVAITRLVDERFLNKRKPGTNSGASITASRADKALLVALLQATVPALEDSDNGVVVAAEETVAKLQLYWGETFQSEAAQFLSNEDTLTLGIHQQPISQFLAATLASETPTALALTLIPSPSHSALQPRVPTPVMQVHPSHLGRQGVQEGSGSVKAQCFGDEEIMFGFVPADVMAALATSRSNSNAEWKKRSVAVEQLYQLATQATASSLRKHTQEMDPLFSTLARLMQDADTHIVKRALQTTQLLFSKLVTHSNSPGSDVAGVTLLMLRLLHSLVETAASFADDKHVRTLAYAVLFQFFSSDRANIAQFQQALMASPLQNRRLQVREEGLRVWTLLLLLTRDHSLSTLEAGGGSDGRRYLMSPQTSLADDASIRVLGRLLGDTSVRVRETAADTAVVLGSVTQTDVYAQLEIHVDDQSVAERIDWATLRRRLRQKQVPQLAQVLPLLSELSESVGVDKSLPGSSELQTVMMLASQVSTEASISSVSPIDSYPGNTTGSSSTDKPAEGVFPSRTLTDSSRTTQQEGARDSGAWGSLSERSYFNGSMSSADSGGDARTDRQQGGSNVTTEEMARKLSALKKKASQLRRTASVKNVADARSSPKERNGGVTDNGEGVNAQCPASTRSKTSPERLAHPTSHPLNAPKEASLNVLACSPRNDAEPAGLGTRRQNTAGIWKEEPSVDYERGVHYQQLSPQKQQDLQTRAVNHEDRAIRSRFLDNELPADKPLGVPLVGDNRPIRPLTDASQLYFGEVDEYPSPTDNNEYDAGARIKRRPDMPAAMSLATRKRLEAKQRQEELERRRLQQEEQDALQAVSARGNTSPTAPVTCKGGDSSDDTPRAAARPISLATRKRLEAKAKQSPIVSAAADSRLSAHADNDGQADIHCAVNAPRAVRGAVKTVVAQEKRGDEAKPRGSAFASHEPRYLESHELTPVANPKQDVASLVSRISRADDWLTNFEALTTVRRLAMHSPAFLEDKTHAVVAAILTQVTNLRSTVSKNALLALESMCVALGRSLDGEVDAIVPVLLKRCGDSNQFVCESASVALSSVVRHCSAQRVVSALSSRLTSRAVPIRREVARCMLTLLTVIVEREDLSAQSVALASPLSVVGKCLEDSNNEVRDAAKQALLFLLVDQQMDVSRIKKLLPAGAAHAKLDRLVASKASFTTAIPRASKASATSPALVATTGNGSVSNRGAAGAATITAAGGSRPVQASGKAMVLDVEAFEQLQKKLESSNWKDRFDALEGVSALVAVSAATLTSSGRVIPLFDVLVKRLDDGNAKVSALALERLGGVLIPALGDGLAPVLGLLLPALSKQLAASNARMAALAQDALRAVSAHVDARVLCQHLAPLARLGNARVKPVLVDSLARLASAPDEKLQPALTRYVVPLSLELLKEAKSEVREANGRLIAALKDAVGAVALQQAASKLSAALQDKLAAALAR